MPSRSIIIKFHGGPFDGHRQPFPESPLLKWLALPVAENTLLLLQGKRLGRTTPIATVAGYKLHEAEGGFEYRFINTVAAKETDLEWLLEVTQEVGEKMKRGRKNRDS